MIKLFKNDNLLQYDDGVKVKREWEKETDWPWQQSRRDYDKTHAREMARLIERKGKKIKNVGGKRAILNFTIISL